MEVEVEVSKRALLWRKGDLGEGLEQESGDAVGEEGDERFVKRLSDGFLEPRRRGK